MMKLLNGKCFVFLDEIPLEYVPAFFFAIFLFNFLFSIHVLGECLHDILSQITFVKKVPMPRPLP